MFQQVMYDTMKRKAEYSEQKETKNKRIEKEKKMINQMKQNRFAIQV